MTINKIFWTESIPSMGFERRLTQARGKQTTIAVAKKIISRNISLANRTDMLCLMLICVTCIFFDWLLTVYPHTRKI